MAREEIPHLSTDKLALRRELEDVLLAYETVTFVSVGFSDKSNTVLLSLGTNNMNIAKAQLITIIPYLERRMAQIGPVELHILKGRTAADS